MSTTVGILTPIAAAAFAFLGALLVVTPVEVEAAKWVLALDKSMGVQSDPRVVAIANAKRRPTVRRAS